MNLPNKLTMLRVVLIPVFVVLYLLKGSADALKWAAVAVFIIASLTDMLDGKIARKNHLVTTFGKFADPLADKLLVCAALICLVRFDLIPTWAVIIIVSREFIISGFRIIAAEKGVVLAASKIAKVKTTLQMITTILLMCEIKVLYIYGQILIYVTVLLTVISLIEYLVKNWSVMDGDM